jgi:hypothetical protein
MPDTTGGAARVHPAAVEIVNGPVPDDHPSHALRLAAAEDLVDRCKRQLANAEADLKRVRAERKGT